MDDHGLRQQETSKRQERADRILDAAAELILRWGYDKTTVDDISRKAGVAKGTIYLHWKTREDLFEALMRREQLRLAEDYVRCLAADPAGATLRGIFRSLALVLLKRPLLKAFLLRDMDVLGKLAQREQSTEVYAAKMSGFKTYLEFLGQHQLVRTDLSFQAQLYTVSAIFTGFFMVGQLLKGEFAVSDEEMADLLAESVHRTLESGRVVPPEEMRVITDTFMQYLNQVTDLVIERYRREIEA
jgi:AcrR family transcriptional regulator